MAMQCPNCKSSEDHVVVWGPRNLAVAIANACWWVVQMANEAFVAHEGWAFKRKCLKCGYRFDGARPRRPDFDECANCGYNLTGNVSGRCSECGWKLPRRYRARRRRTDRNLPGKSHKEL